MNASACTGLALDDPGPGGRPTGRQKTTAQALADRIDLRLAARWAEAKVEPADRADDAEFQRRVTLDLIGRIPTVAEARVFQVETAPDRRRRLIDRLLDQPGYAGCFARFWGERWLPQGDAQFENLKPQFLDWLRERLRQNAPYDRMAREVLGGGRDAAAVSSRPTSSSRRTWPAPSRASSSASAWNALSATTTLRRLEARAVLAVRRLLRRRPRRQAGGRAGTHRPRNEAQGVAAVPRRLRPYLAGTNRGPAAVLADWMTDRRNPYFARNRRQRRLDALLRRGAGGIAGRPQGSVRRRPGIAGRPGPRPLRITGSTSSS